LNHCAVNVALYSIDRGGARWAMTERGRRQVQRDAQSLEIGPSAFRWVGDSLRIELDEIAVPWPSRIRGTVTVHPAQRFDQSIPLAPGHRWCAIAPVARVEVEVGTQRWSGAGYLDSNAGDTPLEQAFTRWDWSRAHLPGGDSLVLYDVTRAEGAPLHLGVRFGADGRVSAVEPPPAVALPATRWRVARGARCDAGARVNALQTLTDAPFYARSRFEAQWCGEPVTAMHESLSLARFDTAWVQAMLPFRMPRVAGR
jgi:carotenoid 1,2-hydratase